MRPGMVIIDEAHAWDAGRHSVKLEPKPEPEPEPEPEPKKYDQFGDW